MRAYALESAEERRNRIGLDISSHRGWYIFEGLLFIAIGLLAMLMPGITALATEIMIGALLLVGGIVRLFNGVRFSHNRLWRLLSGTVLTLAGLLMLFWPGAGLAALITFLGAMLLVEGILEISMALAYRPANRWGWLLVSGMIALLLGLFVLMSGFEAGVAFIAFVIGLSLAFYGMSLTTLALNVD